MLITGPGVSIVCKQPKQKTVDCSPIKFLKAKTTVILLLDFFGCILQQSQDVINILWVHHYLERSGGGEEGEREIGRGGYEDGGERRIGKEKENEGGICDSYGNTCT